MSGSISGLKFWKVFVFEVGACQMWLVAVMQTSSDARVWCWTVYLSMPKKSLLSESLSWRRSKSSWVPMWTSKVKFLQPWLGNLLVHGNTWRHTYFLESCKKKKKPNNQAYFVSRWAWMAQEKNLHEIFRHNSFTSRASMPELQGRIYLHFRTSSEPISPLSICFCDSQKERQTERRVPWRC